MTIDPHIATILLPFDNDSLQWPSSKGRALCLGFADPLPAQAAKPCQLDYVQGFRPHFLKLERAGHHVQAELNETARYDLVFVRLGRHRGQNDAWIASALRQCCPGGTVIAAGGKTDGAQSLLKRLARQGADICHASKNHGSVFWLEAGRNSEELATSLDPGKNPLVEDRYHTAPGMFSNGRVDPGSKLLADHMAGLSAETVADFCAGWGYLSARALELDESIRHLHLYEADHASLKAARCNVPHKGGVETAFFWHDLLTEPPEQRYDAIIMNPPFHSARAADPQIGVRLIKAASKALGPRGRLFMVANRQLPYEAVLGACFSNVKKTAEENGFKVFCARK